MESKWISVEDKLPKELIHGFSEWVLVSTGHTQMEVARYDHDFKKWIPKPLNFTHWMPLPEPPKKS